MLLLLLLGRFDQFVNFIHNVTPQEEVVDLWHIKKLKKNVDILSFTRYATLKDWGEFQYVFIPCTNLVCMCCNVLFQKHMKMNFNKLFTNQSTSYLP
jgi:hypothetical protein